jgi:hypothetical protein
VKNIRDVGLKDDDTISGKIGGSLKYFDQENTMHLESITDTS